MAKLPYPSGLLIVSAPSGAGKTTLCKRLLKTHPDKLLLSISSTTRKARPGEAHGKDYFFLSEEEFKSGIEKGDFAEWAVVHGHYYGTTKKFIENAFNKNLSILLDIDVQGADSLRKSYPERNLSAFIAPPSVEDLKQRLIGRGTDDPAIIEKRLENAQAEMERAKEFDLTIVNDDLDKAYDQLHKFFTPLLEGAG